MKDTGFVPILIHNLQILVIQVFDYFFSFLPQNFLAF